MSTMAESKIKSWKKSGISMKYPTFRDKPFKSLTNWFDGKRIDDNAEGLWRVHDGIYDLTDFVKQHPGGPSWLEQTKGTDITEAFEAHHISSGPEELLEKYKVRKASQPRNMTLTFKEDGFYRTLKKRIREKLHEVDYTPTKRSDLIHSSLFLGTFLVSVGSVAIESYLLLIIAGLLLCWTTVSAHNYLHRKDNWRMYTFNISLMSYRDWRVTHVMSHHLYPNSFHDLELFLVEPFFCWIPNPDIKNWAQRYLSWVYGPIIYAGLFIYIVFLRAIYTIQAGNNFYWDDFFMFSLPLAMCAFTKKGVIDVLITWTAIEVVASFIFGLIGLNAAHHHPDIYHDGDAIRKDRDWGLYQLDATAERSDIRGSQFLVLTHFGDHGLHHLFPTLDHGILPQLYSVLFETLEEFKGQLKDCPWIEHIIGQHKQLARITPTKVPPGE